MHSATVTVLRPNATGYDRFGEPIEGQPTPETVSGVLIEPIEASSLEAERPDGVRVAYRVHFPKGYTSSVRGCDITLSGDYSGTYRVSGDFLTYMSENTPGRWNKYAEIGIVYG